MGTDLIKADLKYLVNLDEPLVYIPSKCGGNETDNISNFTMQETQGARPSPFRCRLLANSSAGVCSCD